MGNKASKAASNTAKSATTASSTSTSTSAASRSATKAQQGRASNKNIHGEPVAPASETKSSAILSDAADPSGGRDMLSRNLASLGQATVQNAQAHNSSRFKPDSIAANTLKRRAELEEAESDLNILSTTSTVRNRLTTGSLTTLLDARKDVKSPAEYRRLCDDFNCDPEVIDRLARFVTSPSLTLQRSEKQEKEDTYLARWVDPAPFREQLRG